MDIRRVSTLPTGAAFVATFFFGGFAACGSVPFMAADPPPPTITVAEKPVRP